MIEYIVVATPSLREEIISNLLLKKIDGKGNEYRKLLERKIITREQFNHIRYQQRPLKAKL